MNTKARKAQSNKTFLNIAAINPTVNDDVSLGYAATSQWFNSVSKQVWVCEDASVGAAVWTATSGGGGSSGAYALGNDSRGSNDASSVQVIPHGLGMVPSRVRIAAACDYSQGGNNIGTMASWGEYDGTNSLCIFMENYISNDIPGSSVSGNMIVIKNTNASGEQSATITVDATNITLTWTKTGTGFGLAPKTINFVWEVFGSSGSSFTAGTDSTRIGTDASSVQTIAHGLGVIPGKIKISAAQGNTKRSFGTYITSGNTNNSIFVANLGQSVSDNTNAIVIATDQSQTDAQLGVITVDATSITITWTKNGIGTGAAAIDLLWEAEV